MASVKIVEQASEMVTPPRNLDDEAVITKARDRAIRLAALALLDAADEIDAETRVAMHAAHPRIGSGAAA